MAMWNTDTIWFDVSFVTFFFFVGNIFMWHFEERSPKGLKIAKYIATLLVFLVISIYVALIGIALIPVVYIHAVVLPRKGINGWTGEPRGRYYEFRGWSKDIF